MLFLQAAAVEAAACAAEVAVVVAAAEVVWALQEVVWTAIWLVQVPECAAVNPNLSMSG